MSPDYHLSEICIMSPDYLIVRGKIEPSPFISDLTYMHK